MSFWLMVAETIQRGGYAYRAGWTGKRISFDFHRGKHTMIIERRDHGTIHPYCPSKDDAGATDWMIS